MIPYKFFFISLTIILFSTTAYSQNNLPPNNSITELISDTIFETDTLYIEDLDSVKISKILYDSILNVLNSKEEEKIPVQETTNNNHFREASLILSYHHNIGISTNIFYNSYYLHVSAGINLNEYYPIIGGLGLGYEYAINKKLKIYPEIISLWYFPTQSLKKPQFNNHIQLGIGYQVANNICIRFKPSIYFAFKNNVSGNAEYNEIIHMMNPFKPFYAIETGTNSTFDIGIGSVIEVSYLF